MFRIEMLPAAHGDCLWIEWGKKSEVYRLLIDGGPGHTYHYLRERLLHLPKSERIFELLVITHIDSDHIEGVIRLLQDAPALGVVFKRIWFNGYKELNYVEDPIGAPLGAIHGEYLSLLIEEYKKTMNLPNILNLDLPNSYAGFNLDKDQFPSITLSGDLNLTLMGPTDTELLKLKDRWDDELVLAEVEHGDEKSLRDKLLKNKRLKPLGDVLGDEEIIEDDEQYEWPDDDGLDMADDVLGGRSEKFGSDTSAANASSIVLLADYEGHRVLLAGDAHPVVLETSIERWLELNEASKMALDVFKIPHHGSMNNITEELLKKLSCRNYLISTSGALFRHPHTKTIDLLLSTHNHRAKPRLHFNYRSLSNTEWSDKARQKIEKYLAFYPEGVSVIL